MSGPPSPPGSIGHVRTARGLLLPLTSLDAVWLTRAVVGEGGTAADAFAIASTMVRRWALLRDARPDSPFRALADLVVGRFTGPEPYEGEGREVAFRGYSQPVAVQWRDPAVERRRRVRELPWEAIEPWRRVAVLGVLTGRVALSAPAAVHFAAPALVAAGLARYEGWRRVPVEGARNAFASTTASRRAAEPIVIGADGGSRGEPRRAPAGEGASPSLVAAASALAFAAVGGLVMLAARS